MLIVSVLVLVLLCTSHKYVNGISRDKFLSKNVSSTLDRLLSRYDKRIRPSFGGPPVKVQVDFLVRSIGPVSDDDQSFGLDCYLRQYWYDMRLRYDKLPGLDEFSMSFVFLNKVWKPDTYFINGKKSHQHKITVPNGFIRVRYDGFITYSIRLTVKASCPMYLRKFPMDSQRCPIILGSYGYTNKDIIYEWSGENAMSITPGLEIAQFELVKKTLEPEKGHVRGGHTYSMLEANFYLERHTGFFMLQVYIPCGLIVLCSWVSFWIDPDDVVARVALSVTTVLALMTMGFGGRASLPKVSYWTALDWFVIICFTSVFSVMLEFACINFRDQVTKDLKKEIERKRNEVQQLKEKQLQEEKNAIPEATVRQRSASMSSPSELHDEGQQRCRRSSVNGMATDRRPLTPETTTQTEEESKTKQKKSLLTLQEIPRTLSATVRGWIDVSKLQDKLTKSIQNLSRLERGFRDADMAVPRVIVTDEDEVEDITLDMLHDEDDDWEDQEDEERELKEKNRGLLARFQALRVMWLQWKLLPQEVDVEALMASPDPPPKFSNIDIRARRSFPLAFFTALSVYLIAYAYYLTDEFPERDAAISLYRNQ